MYVIFMFSRKNVQQSDDKMIQVSNTAYVIWTLPSSYIAIITSNKVYMWNVMTKIASSSVDRH